ncbi:pseudouridine synthase [Pelagophyceae sp. CCMP2097]|nr:pseudouridine synthase [Pelagophyceae sp. CCMP2097]
MMLLLWCLLASFAETFTVVRAPASPRIRAVALDDFDEPTLVEPSLDEPRLGVEVKALLCEKEARLDAVLAAALPDKSRVRWAVSVAAGLVSVNGVVERKKARVVLVGDTLQVQIEAEAALSIVAEKLPLEVLYEDADIIVVNKAPGMVTHPAPGNWNGTLVNAIAHHCRTVDYLGSPEALLGADARPGIVHRLDKGTSGTIVVAKSAEAHASLAAAFAARTVQKTYLAVVAGTLPLPPDGGDELLIDEPIARHPVRRQEMCIPADGAGRRAVSRVRTLASDGKRSVVEVDIETGRTHQIRVHLAHIGTPVLGDEVYGDSNANRMAAQTAIKPNRPLLHAWRLSFAHPATGEPQAFLAPLPPDFERALRCVAGR